MSTKKKLVTDFDIYPTEGEKPLPVGISMRRITKFEKLICDFGDKTEPKHDNLVINHVYRDAGIFCVKVQVYQNKSDDKPQQEIECMVKVDEPLETKIIDTVGLENYTATSFQNKPTSFHVVIPKLTTASIEDISWDFGDGTTESGKKSYKINHTYRNAGCYNVTVKVRTVDKRTDSKSCQIMIVCPANFYYNLALKWAPILYQYIDTKKLGRDLLCKINFEGDWDTSNNREKAREINAKPQKIKQMIPVAYYSVAVTNSHYFILYSFFHLDDKRHENDLEGCLLIIDNESQQLLGMITIAHLWLHKYMYKDRLKPKNYDKMRTLIVEHEDASIHPLIEQERGGHGLYALGRRDLFGKFVYWVRNLVGKPQDLVIYYSMIKENQVIMGHDWEKIKEVKGTPHYPTFYYELVDMLGPEGLWERRNDPQTLKDGVFNTKEGKGEAHAPWGWYGKFDGSEKGMIWEDPARLVKDFFKISDGKEFDENYLKNMFPKKFSSKP